MLFTILLLDAVLAGVFATVGIPGMTAIPITTTLFVIGYSFVFSLCVNDLIKFVLVQRLGIGW